MKHLFLKLLLILFCNTTIALAQVNDSDKIIPTDTILSKTLEDDTPPPFANYGYCFNMTPEEKLIADSLAMFEAFYSRFLGYDAFRSKCLFYRFMSFEVYKTVRALAVVEENLFIHKTFDNVDADPVLSLNRYTLAPMYMTVSVFTDNYYPKLIGEYALKKSSRLKYSCKYFANITEKEKTNTLSSFNRTIFAIYGDQKDYLQAELQTINVQPFEPQFPGDENCYKKNLAIILNSLNNTQKNIDSLKTIQPKK